MARRGRPIELVPISADITSGPCGTLISTDTTDYVFYTIATPVLHQQHIVLHELGHLLCGHSGGCALQQSVVGKFLPNLPVELVRRVLARSTYDETEEREAELFASLVLHRVGRSGPATGAGGADAAGLARLRSAFDPPARRSGRA